MADTFKSYAAKVDKFNKSLTDDAISHALGKMAQDEGDKAAKGDLGSDGAFSGWTNKSGVPMHLDTRYDIVGPGRVSFHPSRMSAGLWTVAEFGRNSSAGPRMVGPRLTKTGKVSKAKQRRYNGRTAGKGTASDALKAIDKKAPGVVDKEVGKAIRKFFD